MGEYFEDQHASYETELRGLPCEIPDSKDVAMARAQTGYEGHLALGKALSRQLRYREAAEAFSLAVEEKPDGRTALRLRAGRYLSSLQLEKAYADLVRCKVLGGDKLDLHYRLGLCCYYRGQYSEAMGYWGECLDISDDEMKIAIIFWHTLCAYRIGAKPTALLFYRPGMEVGHHFAYEIGVSVFAGETSPEEARRWLEGQTEDLHYTITAYGLARYFDFLGDISERERWLSEVLKHDGFWPCYAFLAAWNDKYGGR